jgi:hypothetical protein
MANLKWISVLLLLVACASNKAEQPVNKVIDTLSKSLPVVEEEEEQDLKPDSNLFKVKPGNYMEHDLNVFKCLINNDEHLRFFEDTINGMECSLYFKADDALIDSIRNPERFLGIDHLFEDKPGIVINKIPVIPSVVITDLNAMIPSSIIYFKCYEDEYVLINNFRFSSMAGYYGINILLKLDREKGIVQEYVFESNRKMDAYSLGDFNGDHQLDYAIYKREILNEGVDFKDSVLVFSVEDNKKVYSRTLKPIQKIMMIPCSIFSTNVL